MEMAEESASEFSRILDGEKFFKILKVEGGRKVEAKCLKCGKIVKGTAKQSTNYLSHLKEKGHEECLNEYLAAPKKKVQSKPKHSTCQEKLQSTLNFPTISCTSSSKAAESKADTLKLVNGLQGKKLDSPILSYEKLVGYLDQRVAEFVISMKKVIFNTKFICVTCDAWSGAGRNYLGATISCIAPGDRGLKRKSYVIALQRFDGAHTYDRIRDVLLNLMDKYEIPLDKVVGVVTDGGSNFIKAFEVYGSQFRDYYIDADNKDDNEAELTIVNIDDGVLEGLEADTRQRKLPPHFKCVPHTLHRIASADVGKLLSSNKTSSVQALNKALSYSSELWKLCAYPKQREKVQQVCGKLFIKPIDTRWNSMFRAIERVVQMFDKLDSLYKTFPDINRLSDYHRTLLKEYLIIMEPIANAIDDLQSDSVFLGDFLPSLILVQQLLKEIHTTHLSILKDQVLGSLESRYGDELNFESSENYIVAAVSHPAHKLLWIQDADKRKMCQDMLFNYMQKEVCSKLKVPHEEPIAAQSSMLQHRRLQFLYNKIPSTSTSDSELSIELHGFLNEESGELQTLEKFPSVKQVFLRFNTLLPSQAGSERLFSYGKLILSPRRQTLNDKQIESLALLKCNAQGNVED
ncbi:uncharacterized protein LOC134206649 isoform X2 [Armigeres subalbatus]|uniref:uncharacterized protein LOC134206649 isoform X2 n=1 Tax=Armigeres subalbatus TaxID=124917 RepID=UPI002ED56283